MPSFLTRLFGTPESASAPDPHDQQGVIDAINRSQAVIQFGLDGTIIDANDNFLGAMGYRREEIVGQHHSMFVTPEYRGSVEYRAFWAKLAQGEFHSGQYQRVGAGGREIWIQASYNPVLDAAGKPVRVVKFATDITEQKKEAADRAGQIAAIQKSQAVIEFAMDGRILHANDNFLAALGYRLDEVRGQHHSMFATPEFRESPEYRQFWQKLGRGEYDAGQYKRIGAGGREVWIQASYNPILDASGRPFKVVKYASDITAQVHARQALESTVTDVQSVVAAAIDGNLVPRIAVEGKPDALRALCDGVNAILDRFAHLVQNVTSASRQVADAAAEIAQGNTDLSSRTEQQAASIEETASSMEEFAGSIKQSAESARQANEVASTASSHALRGGEVVRQVVVTMNEISESSKKISQIISVIDSIAFQTNILALNAAVEAARAGEQGRGFAVVAAEVRNLAQRSAGAAKEIKDLITNSVDRVDTGAQLVARAGETMGEIVDAVNRVTTMITEIASSAREQSSGVDQVNQAIGSIESTTEQNAALVEEASAAAQSLLEQARQMTEAVSGYRTGENGAEAVEVRRSVGTERRGPDRAKNVARISRPKAPLAKPSPARDGVPASRKVAAGGGADHWEEF